MKVINKFDIIHYLREYTEAHDSRRFVRLPVKIPILYKLPHHHAFHECSITDVSREGIGIIITDLPPGQKDKPLEKYTEIKFKIFLLPEKRWLEFQGEVRWIRQDPKNIPFSYFVGIRYKNLDFNSKIEILRMGLKLVTKRLFTRLGIVFLCFSLLVVSIFAIETDKVAKKTKQELIISETKREELKKDILKLTEEYNQISTQLSNIRNEIARKQNLLVEKEKFLAKQNSYISNLKLEIQDKIKQSEKITLELEEIKKEAAEKSDFLKGLQLMIDEIISEWNLSSSSDNLHLVVLDERYEKVKSLLKDKKTEEAILILKDLQKKYPDSILLYRLFYRTLKNAGKNKEAEELYNSFSVRQKKSWE